jgi:hypothetical protein
MPRGKQVQGFCYRTRKPVEMTAQEWWHMYRECRRVVEKGETAYYLPAPIGGRVAEAYAIIPEGK